MPLLHIHCVGTFSLQPFYHKERYAPGYVFYYVFFGRCDYTGGTYAGQDGECIVNIGGPEKHPRKTQEEQYKHMTDQAIKEGPFFRQFFASLAGERLIRHDDTVQQAPDHKLPTRAMPEATDKKSEHQRENNSPLAPVAAGNDGGIEDVLIKPVSERYVPAPPVFGKAFAGKWKVEILDQLDSQQPGEAFCHA